MKTSLPIDASDSWLSEPQPDYADTPDTDPYVLALHAVTWLVGDLTAEAALEAAWRERDGLLRAGRLNPGEWRVRILGVDDAEAGTVPAYFGIWAGLRTESGRAHIALRDLDGSALTLVSMDDVNAVALYAPERDA